MRLKEYCDFIRSEGGFALVVVMLVLVALTFMGLALVTTTSFEGRIAGSYHKAKLAYQAADACVQRFYEQLCDPDFNMLLNPALLAGELGESSGSGGIVGSPRARFRAPVIDPEAHPELRFHPNYNGATIDERFGVPKRPNPLNRPGQFMPGMNIARRGSQAEGGMWSYRIWEVQCEGWVDHPDVNSHCGNDLDCAVDWAVSYYSTWVGAAMLMSGEFAESAGGTGH